LTSPGLIALAGSVPEIGIVVILVLLPFKALSLLIFRHRFKVGLIRVDPGTSEEELITHSSVPGEREALSVARTLVEAQR